MKRYLSVIALLLFAISAFAAEGKQYLLQQSTHEGLTQVQEMMEQNRFRDAEQVLKQLLNTTQVDSYDRAMVQQTLGYVYSSTEQYEQAAKQFKQALDSQTLPEEVDHNLRYNLAQIVIMQEQYQQGITLLKRWLEKEQSPPPEAHVLIANAYYQLGQYSLVARHMEEAIKRQANPQEVWYQLLLAAYFELKSYKSAITVLETLIASYDYNKQYWDQLTALYMQQNKQVSALAVAALAQRLELDDDRVLLNLADLYRYIGIPYKSAQLLQTGFDRGFIKQDMKNLRRLADSWLAAREMEKSAEVFKQLAINDSTGESDMLYGRVLFEMEQWQPALQAVKQSLAKLKDKSQKGQSTLLLAKIYFELEQFEDAQRAFEKAVNYTAQRKQAQFWLEYLSQLEVGAS